MTHLSTPVEIAADLRRRAGQLRPPFSTTAIINACFAGARVTGRSLPIGVEEIVTRTSSGILIIYRRGISAAEQRYAIAHAIGHLVYDIDNDADSAGIGSVGNPRCEARADALGSELLVPLAWLTRYVREWPTPSLRQVDQAESYLDHVDQISAKFNAPQHVISERIRRLECLTKMHGEIVLTD